MESLIDYFEGSEKICGTVKQLRLRVEKSLVKNSVYNIVYKTVSVLYPLIAVTYVSHKLLSDKMGMVSYAQNIVSYFIVFAALGVPTYGIREIAVRADDKLSRSKVFWELFLINSLSTSIALVGYVLLVFSVEKFNSQKILYCVAGLQIVFNYFNVDWFYQGLEEYKYISIRSIIVKIIAIIMLPVLVREPSDYIYYALIYCLAIAGNNLFNMVRIRRYIVFPQTKLSIGIHLKSIVILLIVSIAVELYAMIDTTMLGIFCDDSIVGCYSNAMKLTRMITTTAAAIGAVLFPRLSKVYHEEDHIKFNELVNNGIKIMLMIAFPSALGLILIRENIVIIFFGQSFENAIPLLGVLGLMIPIVVCNTLMGGQVLVTTGQEKKYMFSVSIASIINILLNALLIPKYGAFSAAIASIISEAIVLSLYIIFSRRYVKLSISFSFLISMIIPLFIYAVLSQYVLRLFTGRLLNIIINVVVCLIVYFGGGLLLKNEAMIFVIKKFKAIICH